MKSAARMFALASLAVAMISGCHHAAASDRMPVTTLADTVRGIVRIVGSLPFTQVIVSPASGATVAVADGAQRELLKELSGVEVALSGTLTAEKNPAARPGGAPVFAVDHFAVRAVDGVAAQDGVLELTGADFVLRTASGDRLLLRYVPPALRELPGARVFLVGPLDQAPASYGIISRAP